MYIDIWSILGGIIVIAGFGYAIYEEYFREHGK